MKTLTNADGVHSMKFVQSNQSIAQQNSDTSPVNNTIGKVRS